MVGRLGETSQFLYRNSKVSILFFPVPLNLSILTFSKQQWCSSANTASNSAFKLNASKHSPHLTIRLRWCFVIPVLTTSKSRHLNDCWIVLEGIDLGSKSLNCQSGRRFESDNPCKHGLNGHVIEEGANQTMRSTSSFPAQWPGTDLPLHCSVPFPL